MTIKDEFIDLFNSSTGNIVTEQYHSIEQQLGKYLITVIVNYEGKFVGIKEIKEDKKYLDLETRNRNPKFFDLDEFYED